jgi:hypothetical protein
MSQIMMQFDGRMLKKSFSGVLASLSRAVQDKM